MNSSSPPNGQQEESNSRVFVRSSNDAPFHVGSSNDVPFPNEVDNDYHENSDVASESTRDQTLLPQNSDAIRTIFDNVVKCDDAARLQFVFDRCIIEDVNEPKSLVNTEDCLLKLASSGVVDGVYYCFVLRFRHNESDYYFNRFCEYGAFEGFNNAVFEEQVCSKFNINELFSFSAFNKIDVEEKITRDRSRYNARRKASSKQIPSAASYQRQLKTNKSSLCNSYEQSMKMFDDFEPIELLFTMVCVIHKNRKFETEGEPLNSQKVFLCSQKENLEWEQKLLCYRLAGTADPFSESLSRELEMTPDLKTQFRYLSSIPNYYKWSWLNEKLEPILGQRFSACNRYPGSPRNRIIQAINTREESHLIIFSVVKCILGLKCEIPYQTIKEIKRKSNVASKTKKKKKRKITIPEEVPIQEGDTVTDSNEISQFDDDSPVSPDNEIEPRLYKSNFQESLFLYYCGELESNGLMKWRKNEIDKKIIMMNDIDAGGHFKRFQYVHVTATRNSSGIYDISCNCILYNTATSTSTLHHLHQCNHCRLFSDMLCVGVGESPKYLKKQFLDQAYDTLDMAVFELVSKCATRKFSVIADRSAQFVTIFKVENSNREIAQCLNSSCSIGKSQKRALQYINSNDVCPHLKVLCDYMKQYPEKFPFEDTDMGGRPFLPKSKWEENFDQTTGLYTFGKNAPSQQLISTEQLSESLKKDLNIRDSYKVGEDIDFMPPIPEDCCQCSAGWFSDEMPGGVVKFSTKSTLYTDLRVYDVSVYDRLCLSKSCKFKWNGEKENIYRSSSKTAAGYEMGWEYVEAVNSSKQTFSGFVKVMNQRYKRRDIDASFMSLPSFIDWWFGWASHMSIDFRVQCSFCDNISSLACDGTKLGMGFVHSFVEPIETPEDNENIKPTTTRRHNRCYITTDHKKNGGFFQTVRSHLRYVCNKLLNQTVIEIENDELLTKTNILRSNLPAESVTLFDRMISNEVEPGEREVLAKHFKQLSHDCSVDTFLPLSETESLRSFILSCRTGELNLIDSLSFSNRQHSFNKEIAEMISLTAMRSESGIPNDAVLQHLEYLVNFVQLIHNHDISPQNVELKEASYNPCKFGRALYFHPHGAQVRSMRKFSIDNERSPNSNYDDDPLDLCKKIFPQSSLSGVTYLFLWFCPNHGHCYGFHMIPGSEGRKDPAAALYTHLEQPPKNVFYDHACSLSEYVKNRESGFFAKTRFFHDVFHGYTHKCSLSFRCSNINLFEQTNTSICEQFNSYIQRIKASSKHLTQSHFTFYLQFFIHQWNLQQQKRFSKMYRFRSLGNTPEDASQNLGLL